MKFIEFKKIVQKFPVISTQNLSAILKNEQVFLNQIVYWEKKKLLLKLKRGLYILNDIDRKINPSRMFLASVLYSPSYISLEYALGFYGIIPEKVVDITSVSTKKTSCFRNIFGYFVYQHIKPDCFHGFIEMKDEENLPFFIAEPEKAIVDFLYLNLQNFREPSPEIFQDSYRFQNISKLNIKKLKKFSELYKTKKLNLVLETLIEFIKVRR